MSLRPTILDKFGFALLAILLVVIIWMVQKPIGVPAEPVLPGTPLPPIHAEGWLNVPEGESFNPTAKIVVVDFWASYCGPCRDVFPRIAKMAEHYRPLGVEFVSLTDETAADLPSIKGFVTRMRNFDWPIGYGAGRVMGELNIYSIPVLVVFGPDGRARQSWAGDHLDGVERTLDELLAESK
jgi:thiol-disulfide isomerase/thioredoxin